MYCASFRAYISGYTRNIRIIIACMCLPCWRPIIVSPLCLVPKPLQFIQKQRSIWIFDDIYIYIYIWVHVLILIQLYIRINCERARTNDNRCVNYLGVLHPLAINWKQSLPMPADRWSASTRKTLNSSDTSTSTALWRRCNADNESSHDRIRGKPLGWFSRVVV